MSLRIEIKHPSFTEISGTSKAGNPYTMRKQPGYAYTYDKAGMPNPYPELIEINLEKDQPAFPVGFYTVSDSCFFVGDIHQLSIGRLVLTPVAATASSAKAANA